MARMDVREKLVELLHTGVRCPGVIDNCNDCPHHSLEKPCDEFGATVDMLVAHGVTVQEWISVDEKLPQNFISVLGYMTDAGEFPPVRECYTVGNVFFFPALGDIHPVSHWCEMPKPPKGE